MFYFLHKEFCEICCGYWFLPFKYMSHFTQKPLQKWKSGNTMVIRKSHWFWPEEGGQLIQQVSFCKGNCNKLIKNTILTTYPGGGVIGSSLAGYVPLASQNPNPIIVYSVASYRPHLSHFWTNVIVISRTELNVSWLLDIKTTAGTIFQPQMFLFLNLCLPEFSYPKNPENLRPHSSNSTKNVTPL